jgi:predicted dienelactone hydrolase
MYRFLFTIALWTCLSSFVAGQTEDYDPLKLLPGEIKTIDLMVSDSGRNREIPLRVYLPTNQEASPVVLFSHGLGGTREGSAFLGKHWGGRGYVAVFLQHPGSDDSVWKDLKPSERMAALQEAAGAKNFLLRVQDVPAVLDQLAKWQQDTKHELAGRLDLEKVGMSGHSFGAVTTQAVSGQAFALGGQRLTERRIQAAVLMSPSVPKVGSAEKAFGSVKLPWLLMTGTLDSSPIGGQTPESRRAVYPALPAGDKYHLVLEKAEHSAFTERALPGEKQMRNPNHHRAILALSTAFWDAYLRQDQSAKNWLSSDAPRKILEPADIWEHK